MRTLGIAVVTGVGLGLAARAGDRAPGLAHDLTALGGPWLAVAFAVGVAPARLRVGAATGATCLVTGVLTYYALMWQVEHLAGPQYAVPVALAWVAAAAALGAAFGALGAGWRAGRGDARSVRCAALLAGALLGEALLAHALWTRPAAEQAVALQALVAVALLVALVPRPRGVALALPLLVGATGTSAVLAHVVRETARTVGWAGA